MVDSTTLLRWALAGVLGAGAVMILRSGEVVHVAIGVAELVGALLLLVPRTRRLGGYTLLAVLAVAAAIHGPPLAFIVYAAAIVVAMRRTR